MELIKDEFGDHKGKIIDSDVYLALDNLKDTDFLWTHGMVREFDRMYKADIPLEEIAMHFNRSKQSVIFLTFDRFLKGKVQPREGWVMW
ncbi:MAG: hypothetical protein ACI35R_15695 [Bacillus sp. (in: firmicutes)]